MSSSDTSKSVFRSAIQFFSGTLFSRISGMFRDIAMAFYFGANPSIASFMLAYRFAYLMRRLFGESILHQGFIPHFESIRKQDPQKSALFFRDIFWTICHILFAIVLVLEISFGVLCKKEFFASDISEIIQISLWILPGIFFICLFGLCSALLQCQGYFLLSSISPVIFNIVWIFGIFIFKNTVVEKAVFGLALVLSFAFFIQWITTVPISWKYLREYLSFRQCFMPNFFSKYFKELFKPIFLGILGVASVQINSAIDGIFARFSSLEGPAYLWYAIRIQQLPLSLFAIALSSALLPSLSRAFQQKDQQQFCTLLCFAKQRTYSLIFPCMIGIFILGIASVNLLFGRGEFSSEATLYTTKCLWGYGIGLLPFSYVQILATIFYAKKNYRVPAMGFIFATFVNIFLNSIFIFYFHFGVASVALSTSIAAISNVVFLLYYYAKEEKKSWNKKLFVGMGKTTVCSIFAGIFVLFFSDYFLHDSTLRIWLGKNPYTLPRDFGTQLMHFVSQAAIFFPLFLTTCFLVKNQDIKEILHK